MIDTIRQYVGAGTGLTAAYVVDSQSTDEVAAHPAQFVAVTLTDARSLGTVARRISTDFGTSETVVEQFHGTALIDFIRGRNALQRASQFAAWTWTGASREKATDLDISIIHCGVLRNLSDIQDGDWENRVQVELTFVYNEEYESRELGHIELVPLSGEGDTWEVTIDDG